jgi:hypothetical protein
MAFKPIMAGLLAVGLMGFGAKLHPDPIPYCHSEKALRLNDIQVIGSHNSYRDLPPPELLDALEARRPGLKTSLSYQHPSLERQLDLGVRQIELDVAADPVGGRYRQPFGETLPGNPRKLTASEKAALSQPGFKVLHIPDFDYLSHCVTLKLCLKALANWSASNPGHAPITITIDAKERPYGLADVTDPLLLTPDLLNALDQEVRDGLGGKLMTPDDVRGAHKDLRTAIVSNHWPTLEQARGRFLVVLDVTPSIADRYRQNHPSLRGRAMFAQYPDVDPEAAYFIVQDPLVDEARITQWVRQGFMVRTRSDANTLEARANDKSKMRAAIRGGAQAISTDYYPGAPDPLGLGFVVSFDNLKTVQCNVVRVGSGPLNR